MFESNAVVRSSLLADLLQLGRILAMRRARPGGLSPDFGKLPWLVLLYCLFSIALSIALNGWTDGEAMLGNTVLVPFGGMAFAAGLLKWIDRRQDGGSLWLMFTLLLLMLPLAGFIGAKTWPLVSGLDFLIHARTLPGFAAWFAGMLPYFVALLPHLWLTAAGTLFVARAAQDGWLRGLYVPLTPLILFSVFTSVDPLALWRIRENMEDFARRPAAKRLVVDEDVFYAQPRLLTERLEGIGAGTSGVPEIFFLGIAGSEESVFMREVIAVEQLFTNRYATAGHSIILINNTATARRIPFASHESLLRALRRIGERMNGEEDLLFLFLTSHGSSDHQFSIKLEPFGFSDLTAQMLRKALDDSGIKRRVVVISACYSGGFIPALADRQTLVITASSADRNSFGCVDTEAFTDFGRAYFGEALRETRSFTEAFERAKAVIADREAASGLTPSQPQIAGGEALRAQLEWFARKAQ